jgi:hypothetical protein
MCDGRDKIPRSRMHLIIAEKHIAAKRIANILSAGKLSQFE